MKLLTLLQNLIAKSKRGNRTPRSEKMADKEEDQQVEVYEDNYTPIHDAANDFELPRLRSLLSSNRWPVDSRTDSAFNTPLHTVVSAGHPNTTGSIAAIQLLVSHG